MIKRAIIRGLRGLLYSSIGAFLSIYGNHPIYGPIATTIGLALDKLVRDNTSANAK